MVLTAGLKRRRSLRKVRIFGSGSGVDGTSEEISGVGSSSSGRTGHSEYNGQR